MAITFDKINRIIEVEAPDTTVTIQQLINAIRDWEDELGNFETNKVADASGKDDLGGGTLVGITLKFLNWKLKFEAKGSPTTCYVGGGNLVAVDGSGNSMFPIAPSTNVTVQLTQASSATLAQIADIQTLVDRIGVPTSTIAGDLDAVDARVEIVRQTQEGRWRIQNNQLIVYDVDDETPLRTFDLFDENGQPTSTNVYERRPV